MVGKAGAEQTGVAAEALETLCRAYWYPLYAFLRRSGYPPHDAQDWAQSFFEYLLENRVMGKARQEKGRFRSFLLATLKHFISSEQRRLAAQKRGGGRPLISLDDATVEERYAREPAEWHTPETIFELSWARTVLARAAATLEQEHAAAGKQIVFARLQPYLQSGRAGPSYAETAAALGKSEDAIKSGVLRLRQRFQQLLRAQIAETVETSTEVEEELQHLRRVLTA
ncbi:MAG: sigma-70 family RNA polymerase sigma factor [Akkermansiaceae bacterium]|nr:sigma-70 family RNA polymerase sigma factor [Verrucomicrobiales bacterium]